MTHCNFLSTFSRFLVHLYRHIRQFAPILKQILKQLRLIRHGLSLGTCRSRRIVRNSSMLSLRVWAQVFAVLFLACFVAAQERSDAAAIRSLELQWTDSYRQHKIDILSSLLADEFVITVEDGNVYSKAGYISHTADSKVHVQTAEMSDLKVRMHGDTAIVTGAYHEKGDSEGKPYEYHDRFTDVWMKATGKWHVAGSHYSVPFKP